MVTTKGVYKSGDSAVTSYFPFWDTVERDLKKRNDGYSNIFLNQSGDKVCI